MGSKIQKIILFYNPGSGNGLFKNNLDHIISRCQKEGYLLVPIRAAHGHVIKDFMTELDRETYKDEYKKIIAAGGDGTINVCVNAMIENNIDLPIAIFPAGTANDFAYAFNMPNEIDEMLDIALGESYTMSDVGIINGKYFINVAAMGRVVDVSQKTDPTLKNTIGVTAYYLKGLAEIPNLKPTKVVLTTREKVYREKMYFMVVMNGKSAGGFKKLAPNSEVNDGLLDVILFRSMTWFEMPRILMKILQGNHSDSKKVLHFQTDNLVIESESDLPTDIDGEHGENFPLEFGVLHNRLKILTAANSSEK